VGGELPVGFALGGGGEGLFAGEITEFELGVVVAVADDVGVVGVSAADMPTYSDAQVVRGVTTT
jgi:hypothetical protein